jgi:hypothetical protein
MKRATQAVLTVLALSSGLALAQAPKGKPMPGPENQRLGYFVGKWHSEGDMKASPFGPGGRFTDDANCEWFAGHFSVVCRSQGTSPMGPGREIGLLGYSTEAKAYTYYGIDNGPMIMTTVSLGTWNNGTWVYQDEAKMGGKMMKSRYTMVESSPTAYTFKWEMQGEDGSWQTMMEGKATKK